MKKLLALATLGIFAAVASPAFAANSQSNKMKECQAQAGEKKLEGKDRQNFVNECLKAKPAKAESKSKSKLAECNAKTKGMTKEEADKTRSECMKAK
ncbi:MAG: phosphate starvation-inducible protein PsiF [Proteobacteria bacterium]|jgi:hypothetical protein|nr:phosphate starvation-inducible protein PsiF [Pseudomonadota bacterium]